ncbi:MAG: hypothetical protein F4Z10_09745 [Synechococcus sp. SB0666_bin_14]|nr:hypothetical protein [Synechococcus sp. SB0666_bin_14]
MIVELKSCPLDGVNKGTMGILQCGSRFAGNVFLFAALVFAIPFAAQADPAGYKTFSRFAPHHGQDVEGGIWYPAFGSGRETTISENAAFYGVTVSEDAPMADGGHPLVLLSHGLGGHFYSLAWLAAGLAERGAIVIAVNHPNSTLLEILTLRQRLITGHGFRI